MINTSGFISTGLDNDTIAQVDPYTTDEVLIKAMNKQGLVQKEITVQGKHGMYTRKQWVKAGEAVSQPKSSSKIDTVGDEAKISLTSKGNILNHLSNIAYNMNNMDSEQQKQAVKDIIQNAPKSAKGVADALNSSKIGYTNWKPVKNDKNHIVIQAVDHWDNTYKLSLRFPAGYSIGKDSTGKRTKITADSYNALLEGIESQGFKIDAGSRRPNPNTTDVSIIDNGSSKTVDFNKYSDGKYEMFLPIKAEAEPKVVPTKKDNDEFVKQGVQSIIKERLAWSGSVTGTPISRGGIGTQGADFGETYNKGIKEGNFDVNITHKENIYAQAVQEAQKRWDNITEALNIPTKEVRSHTQESILPYAAEQGFQTMLEWSNSLDKKPSDNDHVHRTVSSLITGSILSKYQANSISDLTKDAKAEYEQRMDAVLTSMDKTWDSVLRYIDGKSDKVVVDKPKVKAKTPVPTTKLSKADAKKKTQAAVSGVNKDVKSRNNFMKKVKNQGVTWKENDNPGINWMRCCMAMNSHFENGGQLN